jgi:two-component system, NarL family, invasion response regulator UvrY
MNAVVNRSTPAGTNLVVTSPEPTKVSRAQKVAPSVFIVDDHALMREGLRALLNAQGLRVVGEAAEANAAVSEILRLQPDVLLLDIGLAHRSGLDLLARLRVREAVVQVVMLTMSAHVAHVAQAWRLGARAFVLKGSSHEVLMQGIQTAAGGGRYLDPALAHQNEVIEQHAAAPDPLSALSLREREVMLAVVRGRGSHYIAEQLHLSSTSVDTYRSRLMAKLGVRDITALVRLAVRAGMLDLAVD